MIDARWLILIVPVSMIVGAAVMICAACIIVGKEAEDKMNKACGKDDLPPRKEDDTK